MPLLSPSFISTIEYRSRDIQQPAFQTTFLKLTILPSFLPNLMVFVIVIYFFSQGLNVLLDVDGS